MAHSWRKQWKPTPVCLPGEYQGQEPGGPLSMGPHRVGHDWRDLAAAAVAANGDILHIFIATSHCGGQMPFYY